MQLRNICKQQQQQYLFARMAGNQKEQLPIKAGSLQKNTN